MAPVGAAPSLELEQLQEAWQRSVLPAVEAKSIPTAAMLNTWAAYGIAFLVRPVGGVILARVGDRYGRRHILYVTITLMSVAG